MRFVKNYNPLQDASLTDFFNRSISEFVGNDSLNSAPSVNITENSDQFQIQLAAPGLSKENFDIQLEKNQLTISSAKEEQKLEEGARYNRREFNYTAFKRSFKLSETVDLDKISAVYENGVLYVNIPKKAEVKFSPKTIAIQ